LKEEEIAAKLKEAAKEGKISCALAQKIAIENKISMKQVGNLLNKMKIKIAQCQLGCF
jgi:FAD synthase